RTVGLCPRFEGASNRAKVGVHFRSPRSWCPRRGLNARPLPYQGSALPLSYLGAIRNPRSQTVLPHPGAGEGNRTLVISLEGFCSTIELHPQSGKRGQSTGNSTGTPIASPAGIAGVSESLSSDPPFLEWRGKDSNLRRQSRQIYSLLPLTAREPLRRNARLSQFPRPSVKHAPARRHDRGAQRASFRISSLRAHPYRPAPSVTPG